MGGLFGGSSAPAPQAPPPVPTTSDATAAAQAQIDAMQKARQEGGRSSTMLTGGSGLSDLGTVSNTSGLLGGAGQAPAGVKGT